MEDYVLKVSPVTGKCIDVGIVEVIRYYAHYIVSIESEHAVAIKGWINKADLKTIQLLRERT